MYVVGTVGGEETSALLATKYTHAGELEWTTTSSTFATTGKDIVLGADDESGLIIGSSNQATGVVLAGVELNRADGALGATPYRKAGTLLPEDRAVSVAVDPAGDIYVGARGVLTPVLLKYDASGTVEWTVSGAIGNAGAGPGPEPGYYLTATDEGAIWAAGGAGSAAHVIEIGPTAEDIQTHDLSTSMAIAAMSGGPEGRLFVAGITRPIGRELIHPTVTALDANGGELWAMSYGSVSTDEVFALTVDGSGNIYVLGGVFTPGTPPRLGLFKVDPDGTLLWEHNEALGPNSLRGESLVMSPDGEVVVGAAGRGILGIAGFDPETGERLWLREHNDADQFFFASQIVALEPGGYLISGSAHPREDREAIRAWLGEYDATGQFVGEKSLEAERAESGLAVALHPQGGSVQVGYSRIERATSEALVIRWP